MAGQAEPERLRVGDDSGLVSRESRQSGRRFLTRMHTENMLTETPDRSRRRTSVDGARSRSLTLWIVRPFRPQLPGRNGRILQVQREPFVRRDDRDVVALDGGEDVVDLVVGA